MQLIDLGPKWELWLKYDDDTPWKRYEGDKCYSEKYLCGSLEEVSKKWLSSVTTIYKYAAVKKCGEIKAHLIKG